MNLKELRKLLHGADADSEITLARKCADFDREYEIAGVKHENKVDPKTRACTQKIVILVEPKKRREGEIK